MTEKQITFRIQRYKIGDAAPHYESYTVLCDAYTTVLVALQDIRRDYASSLMLRHSCHHASCGTCGMIINGQEQLACVVQVMALGTSTVTVEPLNNYPIISDLVVEMNPFYRRYTFPDMAYVRTSEYLPEAVCPDGLAEYARFESCIECGICVSACPISGTDSAYLGPAALAAAWRVVEEPRGKDPDPLLTWLDNDHGCWRCHIAFECSEVCPSGVDPAGAIMSLRQHLIRQKIRRVFKLKRG